jgi:hypothetical protein
MAFVLTLAALSACWVATPPVTIYGDGDISCPDHKADDQSLPVGTVVYQPRVGEIRVIVTLIHAAPNATYGVEVWSHQSCKIGAPLGGRDEARSIDTDENGMGKLDFVLRAVEPGIYGLNVNLCCGGGRDPRHREMGTAQFTTVMVR